MNEDFFFYMLQSMSMLMVMIGAAAAVFLAVPYLILRVRDWKHGARDRQLGLKVAMHFLVTHAMWTAFIGLTFILTNMVSDNDPTAHAVGIGMVISGGLLTWLGSWILRRSNDGQFLAPRRVFSGIRMTIAWLTFAMLFTALLVQLFDTILSGGTNFTGGGPTFGRRGPAFSLTGGSPDGMKPLAMATFLWFAIGLLDFFILKAALRKPEVPPYDSKCALCEYDVIATIQHGGTRCPECGTTIAVDQIQMITQRGNETVVPV